MLVETFLLIFRCGPGRVTTQVTGSCLSSPNYDGSDSMDPRSFKGLLACKASHRCNNFHHPHWQISWAQKFSLFTNQLCDSTASRASKAEHILSQLMVTVFYIIRLQWGYCFTKEVESGAKTKPARAQAHSSHTRRAEQVQLLLPVSAESSY